jgi:hypothetical protein
MEDQFSMADQNLFNIAQEVDNIFSIWFLHKIDVSMTLVLWNYKKSKMVLKKVIFSRHLGFFKNLPRNLRLTNINRMQKSD